MTTTVLNRVDEIKVGQAMKLYHGLTDTEVTGMVVKTDEGFEFGTKALSIDEESGELSKRDIEFLLSKEEELDSEDLDNLNEILMGYRLSFIEYK